MGAISSPGIGSGLDVTGIVTGLVEAERVPFEARIAQQEEETTETITALGSLVSATAAFEDAAKRLNDPGLFEVNKVTGDSDNFSTSVSSSATEGSYSIEVVSLAQGQKLASQAYSETDNLGSGTMNINVNGSNLELTLDGTENLTDLRDMINDAENNPGLYASIITDDEGQHLILNSKEVGLDNAISITVDDDDGNDTDSTGLSAFVYTTDSRDSSGATAQVGSFAATTDLVGDGTLSLSDGTNSFNTVTDGLTLEQLRDQINSDSSSAGSTITASIVTDEAGNQQLHLDAGVGNQVTVTAADNDGNNTDDQGISALIFDPNNDTETKGGVITGVANMDETQAATDAQIIIDGSLTVTQSSNVFSDAIEGVTITATKVNDPGDTNTITVSQDTSQVGSALADFAAAYNTFLETTASLGRVNVDSNIVGALAGDSLLRQLNSQVRNVLSQTIDTEGGVNSLASLGLTTTREGLLEVDESLLASQVNNNFDDVQRLFTGEGSMGEQLTELLGSYTGGDGSIQAKIEGHNTTLDRLEDETAEFEERMTALEARLYAQYNAMDLQVAQLNSTGQYLSAQLDNLPGVVRSDS